MARPLAPYLRHIHLPADVHANAAAAYPAYCVAAAVQARLQRAQLDFKAASSSSSSSSSPTTQPPPPPAIVTFTPTPTYTLGRRQGASHKRQAGSRLHTLPAELEGLARPLLHHHHPSSNQDGPSRTSATTTTTYEPVVLRSDRGGLTTYHGPGQLVIWPVIDLKGGFGTHHNHHHRSFGVREYANLLQDVTVSVLRRLWGLEGTTTCDPGVWVSSSPCPSSPSPAHETRKVAAMGVHLRRHVTGLGVALNLCTPVTTPSSSSADAEELAANPWLRFVPCGLEGKHVTSVAEELSRLRSRGAAPGHEQQQQQLDPASEDAGRSVAAAWAAEFTACIGRVDQGAQLEVRAVDEDEVRQLVADVADEARLIEEESRLWPPTPDTHPVA